FSVADGGAGGVYGVGSAEGLAGAAGAEVAQLRGGGARGVPPDGAVSAPKAARRVLVGPADGGAGGVDRICVAVRGASGVGADVAEFVGGYARGVPADGAQPAVRAARVLIRIADGGTGAIDSEGT